WREAVRTCVRLRRAPPPGRSSPPPDPRHGRCALLRRRNRVGVVTTRPPALEDRGCLASAARARWPSCEHDLGVGEVVVERNPGEMLERLDVARTRPGDDLLRQRWARVALVPADRLAVVAR